jgi:hypothetical protein
MKVKQDRNEKLYSETQEMIDLNLNHHFFLNIYDTFFTQSESESLSSSSSSSSFNNSASSCSLLLSFSIHFLLAGVVLLKKAIIFASKEVFSLSFLSSFSWYILQMATKYLLFKKNNCNLNHI